jgi:carboxypeptidase family protein/tetratricopeptide repeat protein
MRRFTRVLIFSTILLISSATAFAQVNRIPGGGQPTNISGTVVHQSDNSPAAYAKVELRTNSGQLIDSYYTSVDGKWATPAIPLGQYVITVEAEGYKTVRQSEELIGFPGILIYTMLVAVPSDKPSATAAAAAPGPVVSARELGLPQGAQDALHQGTDALFKKHNATASLPFFQKVLTMAPDFYEAAYYQGVALMELGRKKEAEDAYRSSASLSDDRFPEADFALAAILTDQKQYPEAEKLVRAGLQMAPEAWNGQIELARVQMATGRIADAEQTALMVRKLKPDFPRIYLVLANIHHLQDKNDAVLEDLNTYLKMFPDGPYAAQAKAMKEQTEKAMGRTPTKPN